MDWSTPWQLETSSFLIRWSRTSTNWWRPYRYQNRSEVIRAGLRLLLQQEAQNSAKLEALRNATSSGLMQLERGEYDEITSDDLAQYLDELGNQASH